MHAMCMFSFLSAVCRCFGEDSCRGCGGGGVPPWPAASHPATLPEPGHAHPPHQEGRQVHTHTFPGGHWEVSH